jgi:hypothetical protein
MPVVDVAVHFNESIPINKSDRGRISNELVQLVSAHLPGSEGSVTVDLWRQPGNSLPWIRTIRLFRAGFLKGKCLRPGHDNQSKRACCLADKR